jgi:hypothetical protein
MMKIVTPAMKIVTGVLLLLGRGAGQLIDGVDYDKAGAADQLPAG